MALTNNNNTKSLFDFEVSEKETGSYEDYEKMKAYELDEGVISTEPLLYLGL